METKYNVGDKVWYESRCYGRYDMAQITGVLPRNRFQRQEYLIKESKDATSRLRVSEKQLHPRTKSFGGF